jgi:hypothetical protein
MHLVYSYDSENLLKKEDTKSSRSLSIPNINKHFMSLEARILVIERYIFRFNQIEQIRSTMMKIA